MTATRGDASCFERVAVKFLGFSQRNGHALYIVAAMRTNQEHKQGDPHVTIAGPETSRYKSPSMISVIIPTLNAESTLGPTLAALVPAVVDGLVQEAILVDGGSSDETCLIADAAGTQSDHRASAGAAASSTLARPLRAATGCCSSMPTRCSSRLGPRKPRTSSSASRAVGVRRLRPSSASRSTTTGSMPRLIEKMVSLRCFVLALPYGDQGLLISRNLYNRLGGFRPIPLMEDVDLVRRLKRSEIAMLDSRAVTSGVRYRSEGYLARSLRNLGCILLYYLRVPPRVLVRLYG